MRSIKEVISALLGCEFCWVNTIQKLPSTS